MGALSKREEFFFLFLKSPYLTWFPFPLLFIVKAKHAQINLHIYGPQVGVAANTLCQHPHSKVAKDNFEAFCHMWQVLLTDVIQISKQVAEQTNQLHSIALQSSLPRIIKVRWNFFLLDCLTFSACKRHPNLIFIWLT